jgi:dipeptidyl aminopeptidase/acylaminoacyl peptidase
MKITASYGTWVSPITAEDVATGGIRLSAVTVDGRDIYWTESRPAEGGRQVVVRRDATGRIEDVTPHGTNARTRVHEMGGVSYLASDGEVFFSEFNDQRLYRIRPGAAPTAITPAGGLRYADAVLDPSRRFLFCVREDHERPGVEPTNTIVSIPLDGDPHPGHVVASGSDFYAYPRLSADGRHLLWLSWNHPQMPWDGTELWTADLELGAHAAPAVRNVRLVAGGPTESIFQPGWLPDQSIVYVSDRSGWWNLYRAEVRTSSLGGLRVDSLCPRAAEFGGPLWGLGAATWACLDERRLAVAYAVLGRWRLAALDLTTGAISDIDTPMAPAGSMGACHGDAVFLGHSPREPEAVVRVDPSTGHTEYLSQPMKARLDRRFVSEPEPIEFPTSGDERAYALFYPPRHADYRAPPGERPPVVVISHGGPTSAASPGYTLATQFWTTRGFAVVHVDYRGSTGYGREYRRRINGEWGVVDVADCINAARYLAAAGLVDPDRMIARGASAGGFTTLAALTFHPGVFGAGVSYYGVSDLEALARDTHKFELHYLDGLVGPYPELRERYRERSPIHSVDRLSCALLLFQGQEDRVVPPNQAVSMADAVRAKDFPVALVLLEGEQHGFRRQESIRRCLETELAFYGVVFGFRPADAVPPVRIDNVEKAPGGRSRTASVERRS